MNWQMSKRTMSLVHIRIKRWCLHWQHQHDHPSNYSTVLIKRQLRCNITYPDMIRPNTLTAENTATSTDPWFGDNPIFVAWDGRKNAGTKYDNMLKLPAIHQMMNLWSLQILRLIISFSCTFLTLGMLGFSLNNKVAIKLTTQVMIPSTR